MNEYIPLTIQFVSETLNSQKPQIFRERKFPAELWHFIENEG